LCMRRSLVNWLGRFCSPFCSRLPSSRTQFLYTPDRKKKEEAAAAKKKMCTKT
jgi:hypothetical protein